MPRSLSKSSRGRPALAKNRCTGCSTATATRQPKTWAQSSGASPRTWTSKCVWNARLADKLGGAQPNQGVVRVGSLTKSGPVRRSAGFQPAVSQCFQPADAPTDTALRSWQRSADWKSKIQQVGNLRYDFVVANSFSANRERNLPRRCSRRQYISAAVPTQAPDVVHAGQEL